MLVVKDLLVKLDERVRQPPWARQADKRARILKVACEWLAAVGRATWLKVSERDKAWIMRSERRVGAHVARSAWSAALM